MKLKFCISQRSVRLLASERVVARVIALAYDCVRSSTIAPAWANQLKWWMKHLKRWMNQLKWWLKHFKCCFHHLKWFIHHLKCFIHHFNWFALARTIALASKYRSRANTVREQIPFARLRSRASILNYFFKLNFR